MEEKPVVSTDEQLRNIQGTIDQIAEDMGNDRTDIDKLLIRMKTIENQLDVVIDENHIHAKELVDKVEDKVEELLEPVAEVNDRLDAIAESKKKVIVIKPKKQPWYKRWFFRG